MRQVNIVGTSPPSQPSRKIQTLPAPPDMAPANVTLRTASETSLWLRWVVSRNLSVVCKPCLKTVSRSTASFDQSLWGLMDSVCLSVSLCLNGNTMETQNRWATGFSTRGSAHRAAGWSTSSPTAWRENSPSRTWKSGQSTRSGSRLWTTLERDPGASQLEAGRESLVSEWPGPSVQKHTKMCTIYLDHVESNSAEYWYSVQNNVNNLCYTTHIILTVLTLCCLGSASLPTCSTDFYWLLG